METDPRVTGILQGLQEAVEEAEADPRFKAKRVVLFDDPRLALEQVAIGAQHSLLTRIIRTFEVAGYKVVKNRKGVARNVVAYSQGNPKNN